MIKCKENNMGKAKDIGVINQWKEEAWGENPQRIIQSEKMKSCKKVRAGGLV
jgi:hypothetical protein